MAGGGRGGRGGAHSSHKPPAPREQSKGKSSKKGSSRPGGNSVQHSAIRKQARDPAKEKRAAQHLIQSMASDNAAAGGGSGLLHSLLGEAAADLQERGIKLGGAGKAGNKKQLQGAATAGFGPNRGFSSGAGSGGGQQASASMHLLLNAGQRAALQPRGAASAAATQPDINALVSGFKL